MFTMSKSAIVLLLVGAAVLLAAGPPPTLKDPFLGNFIGDWSVARKMGNGRAVESTVQGEWVLNHQVVQLDYGAGKKTPEDEVLVFIGFDETAKSYVCHWVDVLGAATLASVVASLIQTCQALNFGSMTNKFGFDLENKSWTSLIRQEENGQWKTFAEEKWTKK